jgi:hypothetical protein
MFSTLSVKIITKKLAKNYYLNSVNRNLIEGEI